MKLTTKQKKQLAKDKPKSKNQYIDNERFLEVIKEYKKDCRAAKKAGLPKPRIPEEAGKNLLLIAQNMLNKSWFMAYTPLFKEEMLGDALENVIQYFDNFSPRVGKNPFAYFSQIIYYAFKRRIEREKKQLYTKYKLTQQSGVLDDVISQDEEGHLPDVEMYDNINDFIEKYEKGLEEDKKK